MVGKLIIVTNFISCMRQKCFVMYKNALNKFPLPDVRDSCNKSLCTLYDKLVFSDYRKPKTSLFSCVFTKSSIFVHPESGSQFQIITSQCLPCQCQFQVKQRTSVKDRQFMDIHTFRQKQQRIVPCEL